MIAYFATYNGRVLSHAFGSDNLDRRATQMFVNRNNGAVARRQNTTAKPYEVLVVEFEPRPADMKLGDMTPGERAAAVKSAAQRFQAELEANAPAIAEILEEERVATPADIVKRLQDSQYPLTAITALGWGMGPAQLGITDAVIEAEHQGLVVTSMHNGKQMVTLALQDDTEETTVTTLTVTSNRFHIELQRGDRIVAIDGHDLRQPREVANPRHWVDGDRAVSLVNALGTVTEWNLYPANVETVTVERGADPVEQPEPQPEAPKATEKPHKPRRRYFGDLTLISEGEGRWVTEDGRYRVERNDDHVTECDGPHVMRLPRSEWTSGWDEKRHMMKTVKGYQCEGGVEHLYSAWGVWDVEIDDYLERQSDWTETMHESAEYLASYLRKQAER